LPISSIILLCTLEVSTMCVLEDDVLITVVLVSEGDEKHYSAPHPSSSQSGHGYKGDERRKMPDTL